MAAKDNREKEAALPEGQAEKPKKKRRLKRIVIILAILLMTLGGAGLGAYWWLVLREPGVAAQAESRRSSPPARLSPQPQPRKIGAKTRI